MSKTKHEEILSEEMFNELKPIYADANCKNCPSEWFFPAISHDFNLISTILLALRYNNGNTGMFSIACPFG